MRKKSVKILLASLSIVLMISVFTGCGAAVVTKPEMEEGAVTVPVSGSCDISVADGVITVSGETDLLSGSILYISVEAQNGMTIDFVKITKGDDDKVSHEFVIDGEKYDDNVVSVTGHITCAPKLYGKHADIVYETYGDKFENIENKTGDMVWNTEGVIVVFGSESIDLAK